MRIDEIDVNLKTNSADSLSDTVYADVHNSPFELYGFYKPEKNKSFCRMPLAVAEKARETTGSGIVDLVGHTAGGRVRFSTDSPYVAIRCRRPTITLMPHMTLCGSGGFDLYETVNGRDRYCGSFMPPVSKPDGGPLTFNALIDDGGFSSAVHVGDGPMRSYTIHFPLYNAVDSLEIGLKRGSVIENGAPYRSLAPIVFYGSSITQGGCASKPGNAYSNMISDFHNLDSVNLGFSGSAMGEPVMADYIASLDMSVLVVDYDYNAPSADYLECTHASFFRSIREKRPTLPILLISCCSNQIDNEIRRREIIYRTYREARDQGDRNVYFLDGSRFFDTADKSVYTVDGCHPNDAGFLRMAEVIGVTLENILADKAV